MNIQGFEDPTGIKRVLDNGSIRYSLSKKGGRLLPFYQQISEYYLATFQKDIPNKQITTFTNNALLSLNFKPREGTRRCCTKNISAGYTCYDCTQNKGGLFCSECFEFDKHIGHQFTKYSAKSGAYCDCGNPSLVQASSFCKRHSAYKQPEINLIEFDQEKQMVVDIISLGIGVFQVDSSLKQNVKQALLLQILQFFQKLVSNSPYYQKLIARALLQQSNNKIMSYSTSLIKKMITNVWSDQIIKKINGLLLNLLMSKELGTKAILYFFWNLSTNPSKVTAKLVNLTSCINPFLNHPQNLSLIVSKQYIKYFIISQGPIHYNVSLTYTSIYKIIYQYYPNLFYKAAVFLLENIPIAHWYRFRNHKEKYPIRRALECSFFQHFNLNLARVFQNNCKDKQLRDKYYRKIVQDYFESIVNNQDSPASIMILALMGLYNFDLQPFFALKKNELKKLIFKGKYDRTIICQKIKKIIFILGQIKAELNTQVNGIQTPRDAIKIIQCAVNLNISIFVKIYETLKGDKERIISIYLQEVKQRLSQKEINQDDLKHTVQVYKKMSRFIMSYIFSFETSIFQRLIAIELRKQNQEENIYQICRQLAIIHTTNSRKEFKEAAQKWISNQHILRKFIINQYDQAKTHDVSELKQQSSISYNSFLCFFALLAEKKTRIRVKLQQKANKEVLKQQQIVTIIEYYRDLIQTYKAIYGAQVQPAIVEACNYFFEMFMTVFLETKHQSIKGIIDQIISQEWSQSRLNPANKEIMAIYSDQQVGIKTKNNQSNQNQLVLSKNSIALSKKEQMLQKMKANQNAILSNQVNKKVLEEQESEHACIVCRLGQDQEPLFYLCYTRLSQVLMKKIMNRDKKNILLLTSCGHLIHQKCLKTSLGGKRNYYTYYKCFLCNNLSNFRIPFNSSILTEKQIKQFQDQLLTIVAIQLNSKVESLSDPNTRMIYTKNTLSEDNFKSRIFNSIVYMIYLYYLTNSQLFNYYILPIIPFLIQLLKYYHKVSKIAFALEEQKENVVLHIQKNLKRVIEGKESEINRPPEVLQEVLNSLDPEDNLDDKQAMRQIDKLFLRILGHKNIFTLKIKNNKRMNIRKPPQDLLSLKRLSQVCLFCRRPSDVIRLCTLCPVICCFDCNQFWCNHMNNNHAGNVASIIPKTGSYHYDNTNIGYHVNGLYKNHLGEFFERNRNDQAEKINEGEYTLDNAQYEKLLEDIILEKIQSRTQLRQGEQDQQLEEMGLGHLRGRGGLEAALNSARRNAAQGRTAQALSALGGVDSGCPTQ